MELMAVNVVLYSRGVEYVNLRYIMSILGTINVKLKEHKILHNVGTQIAAVGNCRHHQVAVLMNLRAGWS
jgi:hypothetical protein